MRRLSVHPFALMLLSDAASISLPPFIYSVFSLFLLKDAVIAIQAEWFGCNNYGGFLCAEEDSKLDWLLCCEYSNGRTMTPRSVSLARTVYIATVIPPRCQTTLCPLVNARCPLCRITCIENDCRSRIVLYKGIECMPEWIKAVSALCIA